MENNTSLVLQDLNNNIQTLAKIALINLPDNTSIEKAERIVMKEIVNFEMVCVLKPELANLDKQSILIAVKQCIADNLTLSPNAGLVYLYPGKVCVGQNPNQNGAKIYKDILIYQPTSEGELSIARQSGSMLDHKRPTHTFDGVGQVDTVTFEFMVPAYPQPRWEKITFDKTHFAKWKQKSAAKFGGTPNANYTSWNGGIDPEFAASKAIKHGLKKRGRNSNESQNANHVPTVVPAENIEHTDVTNTTKNLTERIEEIKHNHIQDTNFEEVKPVAEVTVTSQTQSVNNNDVNENDLF